MKTSNKNLVLLIDPDKVDSSLIKIIEDTQGKGINYIFVGGSHISKSIEPLVLKLKSICTVPIWLFPGSPMQLTPLVDKVLLLLLISGRNAEYLIGNHVIAAPFIKQHNIETISTGYILIGNNAHTSVSYMSQTLPIPSSKTEIIVATAQAGEMIGNKLIYLESGSGSNEPISPSTIAAVKNSVSIPIMCGGGITMPSQMIEAFNAGADYVIIGTAIEKKPELLIEFIKGKSLS